MYLTESQFATKYKLLSLSTPPGTTTFQSGVPQFPIYHFFDKKETLGPSVNEMFVNAILAVNDNESIYVEHVLELKNPTNNQRFLSTEVKKVPLQYHKTHRRFNRSFALDKTLKKREPLVINYNPLLATYRTVQDRVDYYYDDNLAYIDTINSSVKALQTNRPQFLLVNLPHTIPPLAELRKHIDKQTNLLKRDIKSFNGVLFIELLKTLLGDSKALDCLLTTNVYLTLVDTGSVVYIPMGKYRELAEKASDQVKLNFWMDLIDSLIELRTIESEDTVITETFAEEIAQPVEDEPDTTIREEKAINSAKRLLVTGTITEGEFNRHVDLVKTYQTLPAPTGISTEAGVSTVGDVLESRRSRPKRIKTKSLPKLKGVGNHVASTSVKDWDEQYITEELEPDIINTLMMVQNGPFAVTNIEREEVRDAGNHSVVFKLETKGLKGAKGKLPIEIPKVKPDGTFTVGGVNYRMAGQRINYPLVKTGPSEVVLTSGMSKLFLTSGGKKKNDYYSWLEKQILLQREEKHLTELRFGNKVDNEPGLTIPPMLAFLGNKYKGFTLEGIVFDFTKEAIKVTHKGLPQVGTLKNIPIVMAMDNSLYAVDNGKLEPVPDMVELLNVGDKVAPRPFAELKVKGKQVPMGVLFGYWMGLEKSLKYLAIPYRIEPLERQVVKGSYVLKLSDAKLVIEAKTPLQHLMVAGWGEFKQELLALKVSELNHKKNYSVLFTPKGITKSHELEFDLMLNFWIDPTTEELLKERHYPTRFYPLYVKAVEMLVDRQHHNENDGRTFIERRYSRFNDIVYGQMIQAMRDYHRSSQPNRRLTAPPKSVITQILMDETVSPTEQVNPLGVMGEQDRIVYSGFGGRTNRSLVGRHRVYDKHDRGRISEAFTDDGKAGTVMYYSANPSIANIYGLPDKGDNNNLANQLSFAMLLNPFVIYDDPKRGNYARIQENAWRSNNGRVIPPVITGQGVLAAHRAGEIYAFVAKQTGKITEVTDKALVVQYEDKTEVTYVLGFKTGSAAGKVYPRNLITDRKKGYKFEVGEVLAWDDYSFYRDRYNPTQVNLYNGTWSITCFRERAATYEDASRVSAKTTKEMACDVIHIRTLKVEFNENIKLNVNLGSDVEQDAILAYITPPGVVIPEGEGGGLDYYSAGVPKAKYSGKVMKMDVFYFGDVNEASDSVKQLIRKGDKERKALAELEDIYPNGEFKTGTFIGKQELSKNSAIIQIYIMGEETWGSGDKRAFANSLKTVPGKVYDSLYTLSDGTPIDADFSFNGMKARITPGAEFLGVLAMNVRQIGLNAAKLYRES